MKRKVLIIDDEPIACSHIAEILRWKYDTDVTIVQDYSNLEVLLRTDYSAVVLDMMMPFDEDFFAEVKTSEKFPELSTGKYLFDEIRKRNVNIPIIFFTAFRGKIECDSRSIIISKPNLAINVAKTIDGFITRLEKMDIL